MLEQTIQEQASKDPKIKELMGKFDNEAGINPAKFSSGCPCKNYPADVECFNSTMHSTDCRPLSPGKGAAQQGRSPASSIKIERLKLRP